MELYYEREISSSPRLIRARAPFRSSVHHVEVIRHTVSQSFLLGIFLRKSTGPLAELRRIATERNELQLNVPSNFRDNSTKFRQRSLWSSR